MAAILSRGDELRRLSAYRMEAVRWGLGGDVIQ